MIDFFFFNKYFFSQHIVMENPKPEQENIFNEDIKNPFRLEKLKKETTDTTIEDIRNLSRLEKNEEIKERILRNIRNIFRLEK